MQLCRRRRRPSRSGDRRAATSVLELVPGQESRLTISAISRADDADHLRPVRAWRSPSARPYPTSRRRATPQAIGSAADGQPLGTDASAADDCRCASRRTLLRRAEAAGYTDFWSGETNGPDGFTPLALAAAWTENVRLGTGVVGVYTRGRALLAQEAAALADASGGRFALGIGSSSDRIVEGWNGIPLEQPLTKISETIDFLRPVLAGERAPRAASSSRRRRPTPVPIILAALRGKMLRARGREGRRRVHQLPAARRACRR